MSFFRARPAAGAIDSRSPRETGVAPVTTRGSCDMDQPRGDTACLAEGLLFTRNQPGSILVNPDSGRPMGALLGENGSGTILVDLVAFW